MYSTSDLFFFFSFHIFEVLLQVHCTFSYFSQIWLWRIARIPSFWNCVVYELHSYSISSFPSVSFQERYNESIIRSCLYTTQFFSHLAWGTNEPNNLWDRCSRIWNGDSLGFSRTLSSLVYTEKSSLFLLVKVCTDREARKWVVFHGGVRGKNGSGGVSLGGGFRDFVDEAKIIGRKKKKKKRCFWVYYIWYSTLMCHSLIE